MSLSYDDGLTWFVIKSFEGNCPRVRIPGIVSNNYDPNQDYVFTIPADFPSGDHVIFAWTWFNASGNREMYMSCSPVAIISNSLKRPYGPPLLIANLQANPQSEPTQDEFWNSCHIPHGVSLIFPDEFKEPAEVERAPVALNLQSLPLNPKICSSANQNVREHLKGSLDSGRIETNVTPYTKQ